MSGHNPEPAATDLSTVDPRTTEEKIIHTIMPYPRDDHKAKYLGLRASGFTIREALKLIGCAHSTLSLWRTKPDFVEIESRLPEYRKELSMEYANLEFLRNYRLVLEKDYRVLKASLYPKTDAQGNQLPLTKQEQEYLIKMRTHYTPQQLQVIETIVSADKEGQSFDFTEFVIQASRIEQRVRIEGKQSVGRLPAIVEDDSNGGSPDA